MKFCLKSLSGLLTIFACMALFLAGCEKDSDGPMEVSVDHFSYRGEGFFKAAKLDSGRTIHLSKDTLFLNMGQMWTFSNCALESIDLQLHKEDSVLWVSPVLKIHATSEDFPSP